MPKHWVSSLTRAAAGCEALPHPARSIAAAPPRTSFLDRVIPHEIGTAQDVLEKDMAGSRLSPGRVDDMDEQFCDVGGGIRLCYDTFGDPADPALLLVMGLGTQMVAWHEDFCGRLVDQGF